MTIDSPGKIFVDQLTEGEYVQSLFVVTRINLREWDGGKLLNFRLGDKTGKVSAVLWDNAEETAKKISEGMLVEVSGPVRVYRSELQITIKNIQPVDDPSRFDPQFFLPVAPKPLDELIQEFDREIGEVQDKDYKALLQILREDEEIWNKFKMAPAAKLWHHAYLHGLLDHTLSVVKLCGLTAPFYPRADRDLLIAGAVFHDSGKMEEFQYDFRIDYSSEGRSWGHIFIGASLAERLIDRLPDFPAEKKRLLLHLILSHHGEVNRSPILPMTLESILLHHVENLDAQATAIQREMNNVYDRDREWSGYVNLIERFLYLGKNDNGNQP